MGHQMAVNNIVQYCAADRCERYGPVVVRFTIKGSLMKPKWQKLASLAQKICTLWFQFFGAVFASKG